jgi:hypothetical protein
MNYRKANVTQDDGLSILVGATITAIGDLPGYTGRHLAIDFTKDGNPQRAIVSYCDLGHGVDIHVNLGEAPTPFERLMSVINDSKGNFTVVENRGGWDIRELPEGGTFAEPGERVLYHVSQNEASTYPENLQDIFTPEFAAERRWDGKNPLQRHNLEMAWHLRLTMRPEVTY